VNDPAEQQQNSLVVLDEVVDERYPVVNEERLQKVWDLRVRGITVTAIAKAVGVSVATVYNDIRKIGERYKKQIMQADPVALVTENLQWLDEMERVALYEVHSATAKVEKTVDEHGIVTEVTTPDPNKARFYTAALKAREMKLRLLIDTGIIPTGDPTKMFRALEAYQEHEEDIEKEERTPDEIRESVKRLLAGGRHM